MLVAEFQQSGGIEPGAYQNGGWRHALAYGNLQRIWHDVPGDALEQVADFR